jgi:hypothetical protein
VVILNQQTGQTITQPGWVSSEEQQLIKKLQPMGNESCTEQSTVLQAEIKTTKELIEKNKHKLEELRSTRDCLAESGEYAIDCT